MISSYAQYSNRSSLAFQAQKAGTRSAMFGAVLEVAFSFLGIRAATSGKSRLVAKELFKHSGLPYWDGLSGEI